MSPILVARRSAPQRLALLAVGLGLSLAAQAQYRVVGPDGKVTYTDRPPAQGQARPVATPAGNAGTPTAALPYELRQSATRYPVTLYSAAGCGPCDAGRQYLRQRGIPFAEKVVGNDDGEALQRAIGSRGLPALTVGSQVLSGYSADSWASYLDAAGYPRESKLPGNYSAAAPTPLVAAPAAATAPPPTASTRPELPPPPAPTPGGIRF